MRKVRIKVLRDHLSKELKDLPLAITSDGEVVATILSLEQHNKLVNDYRQKVATMEEGGINATEQRGSQGVYEAQA